MKLAAIVEGHGDSKAFPILVKRIAEHLDVTHPEVLPPMRVPKSKLLKAGELERAVEFNARRIRPSDAIVILVDADDDCPAQRGPELLGRARACRTDRRIAVVLAKREYEAWFLAAPNSIRGKRGLLPDLAAIEDPEAIRNAKGWLGARMQRGYRETIDQPAFTTLFDIAEARKASSFDKMIRELETLLGSK